MVSLLLLTASLELLLFFESAPAAATEHVAMKKKMGGPGPCVIANCSKFFFTCMLETQCRQANLCNAKCLSKKNIEGCNLLCEVLYGHNSTKYRSLLQCMNDHSCLPVSPPDGICLANDTDAIKNLTDMTQVAISIFISHISQSGASSDTFKSMVLGEGKMVGCPWPELWAIRLASWF